MFVCSRDVAQEGNGGKAFVYVLGSPMEGDPEVNFMACIFNSEKN